VELGTRTSGLDEAFRPVSAEGVVGFCEPTHFVCFNSGTWVKRVVDRWYYGFWTICPGLWEEVLVLGGSWRESSDIGMRNMGAYTIHGSFCWSW
jgi:hypothetical protein